jgi:hypothetical protein
LGPFSSQQSFSKSAFCGRIPLILAVKYATKNTPQQLYSGQSFPSWSNYYPEHWFLVSNLENKPIFLTFFLLAVFFCAKLLLNFETIAVWSQTSSGHLFSMLTTPFERVKNVEFIISWLPLRSISFKKRKILKYSTFTLARLQLLRLNVSREEFKNLRGIL